MGGTSPAGQAPGLYRVSVLTALAIAVHHFPEGLADFSAACGPAIGVSIAIAVAIHNIPEGISVAVPIHAATGSRTRAFWFSFLSGLSKPLGALIGYAILRPFFSPTTTGLLFGVRGRHHGLRLPGRTAAHGAGVDTGHLAMYGVIAGMAVMAVSLAMFE